MLDARIVATSTQGFAPAAQARSGRADWMTPSAHGAALGFAMKGPPRAGFAHSIGVRSTQHYPPVPARLSINIGNNRTPASTRLPIKALGGSGRWQPPLV